MADESKKIKKPHRFFFKRLLRSISFAFILVASSLFIGMWGYHHFESLDWLDSYVNAAMILSGMGPIAPPKTTNGKLFEGTYALFSGIVFILSIGIIFAPMLHHLFRQFQIEEDKIK